MEKESTYIIHTDASFDSKTKLGTYAIVIQQENCVIKTIAKKCGIQMENSVECEIFAIYQAINVILSCYINENKSQKFKIKTDCSVAREFFLKKDYSKKIFKNQPKLFEDIKNLYSKICQKLSNIGCSFLLNWIPRKSNKMAHKCSYSIFQQLKGVNYEKELLVIDRKLFIDILNNLNEKQLKIIAYLLNASNNNNTIIATQKSISENVNLSISIVNKILNQFIKINILQKVKNGEYMLLM